MKRILLVFFCMLFFPVMASHIVGGEFEIHHISGNTYRIDFILYFDLESGNPGAQDPGIDARIYRKRDNHIMMDVSLPAVNYEPVVYTQPLCSTGDAETLKITYSTEVVFSDSEFDDPEGYYLVWERCCRNYNTSPEPLINILSVNPEAVSNHPDAAGQTFYLEFPPVVKNGMPFINSTPSLFPPLRDYACVGRPYYTDFQGTDADDDSLVYTLVTPLDTHNAVPTPPDGPGTAPFPEIVWLEPFSLNNIVGGNPDLKISQDGLLTVTPGDKLGLYVFAVKCEEFRDGVKIGEVRRDFQMLVVACAEAFSPVITGRKPGDGLFTYENNMSVTFPNTVSDDERCIEVQVTDPDALRETFEQVQIRAVSIGFKKNMEDILPPDITALLTDSSPAATFRICFDQCPDEAGPFQIGIIAADDACAVPLLDTLKITVNIEPPANSPAYFTTADVTEAVEEGTQKSWPVKGLDNDQDLLNESILTDGFQLADAGFTLETTRRENGVYQANLIWDANCSVFDFNGRTDFEVRILLDDADLCNLYEPDTMTFRLHINLPNNSPPHIWSDLSAADLEHGVDRKIFDTLNFTVFGTDGDTDVLKLIMEAKGFSPARHGVEFSAATGNGTVSSPFRWPLNCDKIDLDKWDQFSFRFILIDEENKCRFRYRDTLNVQVNVHPPDNLAPELIIDNLSPETPYSNGVLSVATGQPVSISLTAVDPDTKPVDHVTIELIDAIGTVTPDGYVFKSAEGYGTVQAPFTWMPDCNIFQNSVYENDYTFKFRAVDNRCRNIMADTVDLYMTIKDNSATPYEFLPPNIVTPNGDGCNDLFALEGFDSEVISPSCPAIVVPNLPLDNCDRSFRSIRIYNRWGNQVFLSDQRSFRWDAQNEAAGVYFYTILYVNTLSQEHNKEYKGTITVRY